MVLVRKRRNLTNVSDTPDFREEGAEIQEDDDSSKVGGITGAGPQVSKGDSYLRGARRPAQCSLLYILLVFLC